MPDYSNGKIYKLVDPSDPETVYIGSTIQPLHKRLYEHRSKTARHPYWSKSQWMKDHPDIKIILIEDFKCSNKRELEQKEDEIICKFKKNGYNLLNCNRAYVEEDKKEYQRINDLRCNIKYGYYYDCPYCKKSILKRKDTDHFKGRHCKQAQAIYEFIHC